MTYCEKCGMQNDDNALYCKNCGNPLSGAAAGQGVRASPSRHQMEDECFGLPNGGAIVGLIFGVLLILIGLFWFLGINFWSNFWYLLLIIVGVLIVAGAIHRGSHRH
jgi:uncharacterized membrane protein YvbJ